MIPPRSDGNIALKRDEIRISFDYLSHSAYDLLTVERFIKVLAHFEGLSVYHVCFLYCLHQQHYYYLQNYRLTMT